MIAHALLTFFLLHLAVGAALPLMRNVRPFFFTLFGSAAREIGRRLNRPGREESELVLRGMLVLIVGVILAGVIGAAVLDVTRLRYGWVLGAAFLFTAATVMAPLTLLRRAARMIEFDSNEAAAELLQPYFPEALLGADAHTLIRKALEFSAVALDTWFIGPLFWFAVMGPPGAMLYIAFSALARAFADQPFFGAPVRYMDMVFNFFPALLTAGLLALAAFFVAGSNPLRAVMTAFDQAGRYRAPCLGWPVAAMAGALGVTLCGPMPHADGAAAVRDWIGPEDSTARLSAADLQRGAMLHFVFFLCAMALAACGVVLRYLFA